MAEGCADAGEYAPVSAPSQYLGVPPISAPPVDSRRFAYAGKASEQCTGSVDTSLVGTDLEGATARQTAEKHQELLDCGRYGHVSLSSVA